MPIYSIFGQAATGSSVANDTSTYTLGMQFTVSRSATLTGIWFFSASGATNLPIQTGIFQQTSPGAGSLVSGSQIINPSWSGAAGSGWVKATYASGPTLSPGNVYKVCILKDANALVYSATTNYWSSGAGSGGKSNGPLTAPNNAGGDGGQDTFITPSAALAYPTTSSNAANYWIDVEVSAAAAAAAQQQGGRSMLSKTLSWADL